MQGTENWRIGEKVANKYIQCSLIPKCRIVCMCVCVCVCVCVCGHIYKQKHSSSAAFLSSSTGITKALWNMNIQVAKPGGTAKDHDAVRQEETISDTIDDVISGEDDEVGAHCLKEPMTCVCVHISGFRLEV